MPLNLVINKIVHTVEPLVCILTVQHCKSMTRVTHCSISFATGFESLNIIISLAVIELIGELGNFVHSSTWSSYFVISISISHKAKYKHCSLH